MKKIVYDFDNTFGVKDCDVDDGLALLYLLGCPDAQILGLTTTYGNNRLDVVMDTTKKMLKELGRSHIPLKKGGAMPGDYKSEEMIGGETGRSAGLALTSPALLTSGNTPQ